MTRLGDDEQWLRERLPAIVPDAPQVHGRGAAVRRRATQLRRRRVAGSVVVVAAAAVVAGALVSGAGVLDHREGDAAPVAPTARTAKPCPGTAAPPDAGRELPDDVVAIRLCAADDGSVPVPVDALVTDVDDVVDGIAGQREHRDGEGVCAADAGPAYLLQLQRRDGGLVRLRVEPYGCGVVWLDERRGRRGAEVVLEDFGEALARQREGLEAPGATRMPACRATSEGHSLLLGDFGQAERAILCPNGRGPGVLVGPRDLAKLVTAWERSRGRIGEHAGCGGQSDTVVAVTGWDDILRIEVPCGLWFGHGMRIGPAGSVAQAIIDRLRSVQIPPPGDGGDVRSSGGDQSGRELSGATRVPVMGACPRISRAVDRASAGVCGSHHVV